ncbi:hypothetical protein D3C80_1626390 [compost metagenome]
MAALGPFRNSMVCTSFGFSIDSQPTSVSVPSSTTSGLVSPNKVFGPRIKISFPITCTPATRPRIASSKLPELMADDFAISSAVITASACAYNFITCGSSGFSFVLRTTTSLNRTPREPPYFTLS